MAHDTVNHDTLPSILCHPALGYTSGLLLYFDLCGKNVEHSFGSFATNSGEISNFLTTSE